MVSVNGERLLARINELGAIGKDAEGRRTRLAASDTENRAGTWFQMDEGSWFRGSSRPDRKYFRYLGDS